MMVTVPHCSGQGVCHVLSMVHVSPFDGHVDDEQAKHPGNNVFVVPRHTCTMLASRQKRMRIPVTLSPSVDHVGVVSVRNECEGENIEHRATT